MFFIKGKVYGRNEVIKKEITVNGKTKTEEGVFFTIKEADFGKQDIRSIAESIEKDLGAFTPKWAKELKEGKIPEYINIKSKNPVLVVNQTQAGENPVSDDEDIIINGCYAVVAVSATWCNGIQVLENGKEYNPFIDCDLPF